ncbi:MAG: Ig-like domain-containing protein [Bacteroidales bacterium]|nr:Ig-like domain-containing protein [Bacteroidales bacterium]
MSRFYAAIPALAALMLLFTGCKKEPQQPEQPPQPSTVAVSGVSLNSSTLSLSEGATGKLTVTVSPSNATNKNVIWKTSDGTIAKIDTDGTVTAGKAGTATISVITVDGAKTAECKVTVTAKTVSVTGVTLDDSSKEVTLEVGGTATLKATVAPADASDKAITWSSSDESVATVSSEGVVTAKGAGTAVITVTTKDGSKTATSKVTVKDKAVSVESVTIDQTTLSLVEGSKQKLVATVKPDDATNKKVTWKSSDPKVATVEDDGTVGAVKAGSATITVTTVDGEKTASCKVTVTSKTISVESVTIDKATLSLVEGSKQKLVATVKPDDATNKKVTWKSSDPKVATVEDDGTVGAVKAGSATITVTTVDGEKTATCKVTVTAKTIAVTGVELDKTSLAMTIGGTYTLTATVKPENASNKDVTWSTSDASIATVSNGKVTAVKKGTATIKVQTKDGSFEKTCTVTVKDFRWFYTQNSGSSTSFGPGGANPEPFTFTYIMGSNSGSLGDSMKITLSDGTGYTYYDGDESHWDFKVVSNNGCITLTKEKNTYGSSSYYYANVAFKKNGTAKVRLTYDNGVVTLSQDVTFNVYLDGSKKWKFRIQKATSGETDFSGNITGTLSDKYVAFIVTDLSNKPIEDLTKSHYTINNLWPDNTTLSTGIYSQQASGRNYWVMYLYFENKGSGYVELNYTDGESMISTKNISVRVN